MVTTDWTKSDTDRVFQPRWLPIVGIIRIAYLTCFSHIVAKLEVVDRFGRKREHVRLIINKSLYTGWST